MLSTYRPTHNFQMSWFIVLLAISSVESFLPSLARPSRWPTSVRGTEMETSNNNGNDADDAIERIILQPFLPAADPSYRNTGPVGEEGFCLTRTGAPTKAELANENILKIVLIECSDLEVNTLVWKCLGYRFEDGEWKDTECFPKWREKYPQPPDLIGIRRIYSPEVDKPSLKANQALVRSVPMEYKQSLKTHLKPYGFKGYKYAELTPNKTRRAQCANWLLYYREALFGYSLEELKEKRERERTDDAISKEDGSPAEKEWKPPVKEVF